MTVIEPSDNEVFLNFLFLQPTVNNTKKGEVQARIVMTPLSIKKMAIKIIAWLQNYERDNGKINLKYEDDSVFDQKTVIDS